LLIKIAALKFELFEFEKQVAISSHGSRFSVAEREFFVRRNNGFDTAAAV
jgi:hypothetical protein